MTLLTQRSGHFYSSSQTLIKCTAFYLNNPTPQTQLMFHAVSEDMAMALSGLVLASMYGLILAEVAHRTVVTMLAATAAVAVLAVADERPSLAEIVGWVDVETLTLLFSMMVIVGILSETGVFR
jgi:P protein